MTISIRRWHIKCQVYCLTQSIYTIDNNSLPSLPLHPTPQWYCFNHVYFQFPRGIFGLLQDQCFLQHQPEFLLQMIVSQELTLYSYPALLKAISPKCILCGQWVSIHAQFHMKRFALFIVRMACIGQPEWKYFHSLACEMMSLAWNLGRYGHGLIESWHSKNSQGRPSSPTFHTMVL